MKKYLLVYDFNITYNNKDYNINIFYRKSCDFNFD